MHAEIPPRSARRAEGGSLSFFGVLPAEEVADFTLFEGADADDDEVPGAPGMVPAAVVAAPLEAVPAATSDVRVFLLSVSAAAGEAGAYGSCDVEGVPAPSVSETSGVVADASAPLPAAMLASAAAAFEPGAGAFREN